MRVAPLYDLVCCSMYGYKNMAQSVGGETNFAVIGRDEWVQFAKDCGVSFNLVQRLAKQLIKQAKDQIDAVHLACGQHPQNKGIKQKLHWDSMPP
jgi:hypothetical protein